MIKKILIVVILSIGFHSNSQTLKTIEKVEKIYQDCLDNGINMKNCSTNYYNQTDSLLNVTYKKLKFKLSIDEQTKLKSEQLSWLKKRDLYFKKAYFEAKSEGPFPDKDDLEMVYTDKKAVFVMERVKKLIIRIK